MSPLKQKAQKKETTKKRPSFKLAKSFSKLKIISLFVDVLRLAYLELNYRVHVRIRYLHDVSYAKNETYKKYSDHPYTPIAHKTAYYGFLASLILSAFMQFVMPYVFNPFKPNEVYAGANTKTWTTRGDFTTGTTSSANINISGSQAADNANVGLKYALDKKVSNLATGENSSFARKNDGTIFATGRSVDGLPAPAAHWQNIVSVDGSYLEDSVIGLRSDGSVVIRMGTGGGLLGDVVASNVGTGNQAVNIADYQNFLVLKGDGTVVNSSNQVIFGGTNKSIAAAVLFKAAVSSSGTINLTGTFNDWANFGGPVSSWTNIEAVSAGEFFLVGLTSNGQVVGSGNNKNGFAGCLVGDKYGCTTYDAGVSAWTNIVSISAGRNSTYGLKSDGTILVTGGSEITQATLTALGSGFTAISGSDGHLIALKNDGTIVSVGDNGYGEVNTASWSNNVPQPTATYSSPGTLSNIKFNATNKVVWSSVTWNTTALPSGGEVKFRAKTADTEAGLAGATWSNYYIQSTVGTTSGTGNLNQTSPSGVPPNRWIQLELAIATSVASSAPSVSDFTVNYDALEQPNNSNAIQFHADGSTRIKAITGSELSAGAVGGWTNESSMKLTVSGLTCGYTSNNDPVGSKYCTESSTGRKIQVQYKKTEDGNFDSPGVDESTNLVEGTGSDGASVTSTATLTGLVAGKSYHIRMRVSDNQGRLSAWTYYGSGANNSGETDFTVEQTVPTLTSISFSSSYTNTRNVSVNVTGAADATSKLSKLYLSNDVTNWTDVTPASNYVGQATFSGSINWTLTTGDGTKNVYAKVEDNAGNTSFVADFGTGAQGDVTITGTHNINEYIASYNGTTTIPNFNNLIIDGTLTTSNEVPLAFKVKGTLTVNVGGKIDADGKGYAANQSLGTPINLAGSAYGGGGGNSPYCDELENCGVDVPGDRRYGEPPASVNFGSGSNMGERGGGLINISVNNLSNSGVITANGVSTMTGTSGGGIQVQSNFSVDLTNVFVIGGNGYDFSYGGDFITGGGGGGGRIFVYAPTKVDPPAGNISGGTGYSPGGNGVVHFTASQTPTASITLDTVVPNGTVTINNSNPTYTNNRAVTLLVSPSDPAPSAGLKDFQLSNNGTIWGTATDSNGNVTDSGAWKAWNESYRTSYSWNLTTGNGTKTVYVKVRDNAGNVSPNSYAPPGANWIAGVGGALTNKYVYNRDIIETDTYTDGTTVWSFGALKWKTSNTACSEPYCQTGLDTNYPSNKAFVADNSLDYQGQDYRARDACKVLGGRLPYTQEAQAIIAEKASYGNNFNGQIWTATEASATVAYTVDNYTGSITASLKYNGQQIRCVAEPLEIPSISDSVIFDGSAPSASSVTTITSNPNNTGNQTVAWGAFSDTGGSGFQKYVLQRKTGVGGSYSDIRTETTQGTTSYADNATLPEGTYYYRVLSYDNAGNSTASAASTVLTIDKTAPSASSVTTITSNPNNTGNQTVSWGTFSDTGGSGFKEYKLQRKNGEGGSYSNITTITSQGTTSYADNSTLAEGVYYYRVLTTDNALNTTTGNDSSALIVDKSAPNNVGAISAVSGVNNIVNGNWYSYTNPTFSWEAPADNGGSGIASYRYCIARDNANCTPNTNPNGTSYTANLTNEADGIYTFRVFAVDNVGYTSLTPTSFTYKLDRIIPGEVTELTAITSPQYPDAQIDISWNSYDDSGADVHRYKLERVKYTKYVENGWNINSDWASGQQNVNGYAAFEVINSPYYDRTDAPGEDKISPATRYIYRISVRDVANSTGGTNNDGYGPYQSDNTAVYGMTRDMADPTFPYFDSNDATKGAFACDGTTDTCAVTDQFGNPNTKGYSIKIAWNASIDDGSGMNKYLIYRSTTNLNELSAWTVIGVLDVSGGGAPATVWYDNDANNDATFGADKTSPTTRLNDYTTYYYRIVAVDLAEPVNSTDVISDNPLQLFTNWKTGTTPDVTAPGRGSGVAEPRDITASAKGLDGSDTAVNTVISDGSGTATSATANTLTDSGKSWTTNFFRNLTVKITSGAGADQEKTILSNTATTLTFDSSWATTPDATSTYEIYQGHQRLQVSWSASIDIKARSNDAGAGGVTYKLYQGDTANGTYVEITNNGNVECNNSTRICRINSLADFTWYYFKMSARDSAGNETNYALTTASGRQTASSAVPTAPTNVSVVTKKGPTTDPEVGDKATISFKGSYAKNCDLVTGLRCITKYEIRRSETNFVEDSDWQDDNKTAKLTKTLSSPAHDQRGTTLTYEDSGLDDSKIYYYKVYAVDNSPADPDGGPFSGPLSDIVVGTPGSGWDVTPDSTAPSLPAGGLEVKVRDTHPNQLELRNIVTWKMLEDSQLPLRRKLSYEDCAVISTVNSVQYCSDFSHYEIHRETINPNDGTILSDVIVKSESDRGKNYFIDIVDIVLIDSKFKYYVQIVDNAGNNFKYANDAKVNPGPDENTLYSNKSDKAYWSESIIPSKSSPMLAENTSVTLNNVNVASAEISWTTDQEADSLVQFREKGSDGDWVTIGQIERTIQHNVKIFGLKPLTEYEYQIVSRNYLGNNVREVGNLPQLITSGFNIIPGAVSTTTTGAEINWTTNLDAGSAFIEYELVREGTDEAQGKTVGVNPEALKSSPRNHRVVIQGLKSNRVYKYKIKSISNDGFVSEYPTMEANQKVNETFTTRSFDTGQFTLAPSSSNVAERNITATTAQIVWQTAMQATSWVDYSTKSGVYDMSSGNDTLTTQHVVVIEGLVPGTTYYYRVRAKDSNDIEYTSQEYSFKAVLKPKISNMQITEIKPYEVTISWDTNVETETLINWGKTSSYGEKKGTQGLSKVHQLKVTNLEDNTEYHFQILAKDEAGNEVADDDKLVRTPLDTEGPKIESVKTDILPIGADEAMATVIISWQTNKPATTLVEYDEGILGGKYSKQSVEDKTLNNSHTVIIKDLKPSSSYHFKIVSKDKRSNIGTSPDHTFVTPSKEKSILQLILKSLEETFAWTKNLGNFFKGIGNRITGK